MLCVCLQSKADGKTTSAAAGGGERAATPSDKKDKPRSERKRVRTEWGRCTDQMSLLYNSCNCEGCGRKSNNNINNVHVNKRDEET